MTLCAPMLAAALSWSESSPWSAKEWGVLLIGGSSGPEGTRDTADLVARLRKKFPVEFASGMADQRELQRGIDRLGAQNVKKLVVVPLVLTTESYAMAQTQYVLGLRQDPSPEFFQSAHGHSGYTNVRRVQTRLPVVMSSGLDDHPLVAEILAARGKELSRRPARERLFIVGGGGATGADNELIQRQLGSLARRVQASAGFADVQSFTLPDTSADPKLRGAAETALRRAVAAASRGGRAIVVCAYLAPDGLDRRVRKLLDGTFFVFNPKGLMPDPKLAQWVEDKAKEAAAMADMRRFKDAGRPIPSGERKTLLRLGTGAPRLRPPSPGRPAGGRRELEVPADTGGGY